MSGFRSAILIPEKFKMAQVKEFSEDDHPTSYARHLEPKGHEVWWYKQGVYMATGLMAVVLWFTMIGPKISTPKTEMIDPATDVLTAGLSHPADVATVSKDLKFKVTPPDLKQLGAKLTKVGKSEFGGQEAAVLQYQYGKSVLLLYSFNQESKLFKEMKQVHAGKNLFYLSSGGAVSVISWKDRRSGYYALAAKATEKDLVNLAGKMVTAF